MKENKIIKENKEIKEIEFKQDKKAILTSKTVEWLVDNTEVQKFDPVKFTGYQRSVDPGHCDKLVKFISNGFFLPSAIICACDGDYDNEKKLRIVDGQHRIESFRILKRDNQKRFEQISEFELPVIVLVDPDQETEISTFINVNKKSKKVDTSLAFVLRNKLGKEDLAMSKAEYIAVECARILNEKEDSLWKDAILFEGSVKSSNCYISLNAFVKAARVLINTLNTLDIKKIKWDNESIDPLSNYYAELIDNIWKAVYVKWPDLKDSGINDKQIIQGAIGFTAIIKSLLDLIKKDPCNQDSLYPFIYKSIMDFNVPSKSWTRHGEFSKYSSEAGYKIVSLELLISMNNDE